MQLRRSVLVQAANLRRLHRAGVRYWPTLTKYQCLGIARSFGTNDGKDKEGDSTEAAASDRSPNGQPHEKAEKARKPRAGRPSTTTAQASRAYKPATPVTADVVLENGEYIDDGFAQQVENSSASSLEQVYQNVQADQLLKQSQQMQEDYEHFASKFGISSHQAAGEVKDQVTADNTDDLIESLIEQYAQAVRNDRHSLEPDEVISSAQDSQYQVEVQKAWQTLQYLQEICESTSKINNITLRDIEESTSLRRSLLDQHEGKHIMNNKSVMEIEKAYESSAADEAYDYSKRLDNIQSYAQSDTKRQYERLEEVRKHNLELVREYRRGEEGIDYIPGAWKEDPRMANVARVKADIRHRISQLRLENPAAAKAYADYFLKRTEVDDLVEGKLDHQYDVDKIVKAYPGSPKGPLPRDDPEFYSEWFMRNQPEDLIYQGEESRNYHDMGVRYKYVWNKQALDENALAVEFKDDVANLLEQNEMFPMQHYEGIPEFDLLEREKYDASLPGKLPMLKFHSHIGQDELLPMPNDHTLKYTELHYELERWSLFRALPQLMTFDQGLRQLLISMSNGTAVVPDFVKEVNPPSLWAYYYTLPKWARDDPVVRNVVMAMEYHQPGVDIRAKEGLLNFACSLLRPIDPVLREVIVEAVTANKVQLNMKLGNQMLNELPFYEMDPETLGSDSDDEAGQGEGQGGDLQSLVSQQLKQQEMEDGEESESPMQAALRVLDQEHRLEDMRKVAEADMSIEDYKVEPMTTQCMTDFFTFEHMGIDDIPAEVPGVVNVGTLPAELPLHYYDNDDGFWDDYIQYKQNRWEQAGLIVNRRDFIH